MAEKSVQKIPKPQLRGLLASSLKFHLPAAIAVSAVTTVLFKIFWVDRRRARYAEFYKNYDAEKDFERMRKAGVFKSC
ncbi:cytochrome c oxidase subunit 6C [Zootermopsis nevadensis]|uniref:Cytochrome c oxidase subunit 6C n=1 Tax=Zootermopsis nevadensis TaxID=136037 RepID=A0A067QN99_ZOONE|nr:cytochrome c oxidase subunit 6C [Zootermopsis nevadensis]KDR10921.1 Cytochrome c oxidase subunit 6C [Zootermopsis nevadensis]